MTASLVLAVALWAAPTAPVGVVASSPNLGPALDEELPVDERLSRFGKEYLGRSDKWKLFKDAEVGLGPPQGGRGRGGRGGGRGGGGRSVVTSAISAWQQGEDRRGRRGASLSIEDSIEQIRLAAEQAQPPYVRPRVAAYASILALFHEAAMNASPGCVRGLLDLASLDERLPPSALEKMADHRPRLVQREAQKALRRVAAGELYGALTELLASEKADRKSAGLHRSAYEHLGRLAKTELRDRASLERIADLCIDGLTTAGEQIVRIAALTALRNLSDQHEDFRLGEQRREKLLLFLEKEIGRAPEPMVIVALRLLGGHPHLDTVRRLATLLTRSPRYPERVQDELWAALDSITPASIPRAQGTDAWLEWYEREKDEPRLTRWIAENSRGAPKPVNDPAYGSAHFYGIPIVGKSVIFVIDVSGSMREPMGTEGKPKIEGAKEELIKSLEALSDPSTFDIVTFERDVVTWSGKPVVARSGRRRATVFVSGQEPGTSTNLHGGLLAAFGLKRSNPRAAVTGVRLPEQIILLSDGNPTAGELTSANEILADIERIDPAHLTRIDTIAFGHDADRRFLGELAKRFNGKMADVQ